MLEQICAFIHNYFERESYIGTYIISDGTLTNCPQLKDGQYFRIDGSALNDGVYQYPDADLTDETFEGTITAMAVPKMVLELADEIEAWVSKYGTVMDSPYQSESFGGYTYTKASGASGSGGDGANGSDWRSVFKSRLNHWRKIA